MANTQPSKAAKNSTTKTAGSEAYKAMGKTDVRQQITDKIVAIMERGVQEWRKCWASAAAGGMPSNGSTGAFYRGVNVLMLWIAAQENGYKSSKWLTYRQAQALGGQVRKGEKSTSGVYFEMLEKEPEAGQEEGRRIPMAKAFCVFNIDQIDGLPTDLYVDAQQAQQFQHIEAADALITNTGAVIHHGGSRAAYAPALDVIVMPKPEDFTAPANYYATCLHELTHWTGHETRLNRTYGKRFGDQAYAVEELVAELGSAFLGAEIGFIDGVIEGHASYLESWLKVLKADKSAIFTAASAASSAASFITKQVEPARLAA